MNIHENEVDTNTFEIRYNWTLHTKGEYFYRRFLAIIMIATLKNGFFIIVPQQIWILDILYIRDYNKTFF